MKHIKSKQINRLTDELLSQLLRVSTSEIDVDFAAVSLAVTNAQISH